MPNCRRGRLRPIRFECKRESGHDGECSPYTLPPQGNWLDWLNSPFGPASDDDSGEARASSSSFAQ